MGNRNMAGNAPDSYRASLIGDGHILRMTPEPLEIVVGTGFFRKNVDQVVAVIGQYPVRVLVTFDTDRVFAAMGEVNADFFTDGLDLARIRPGADDEEIRERCDFAQVQDFDIEGFFGFSGTGGSEPRWGVVLVLNGLWKGVTFSNNFDLSLCYNTSSRCHNCACEDCRF